MITVSTKGDFSRTFLYFERLKEIVKKGQFDKYGQMGVDALAAATPKKTGKTAASWAYKIVYNSGSVTIQWYNTNVVNGTNIAVILQYGHGKKNGGYVKGINYINPAMKPVFDQIAANAWKEVKNA